MTNFEIRNNARKRKLLLSLQTFTIKIDQSKLNLEQKEYLHKIFIEAKWVYNWFLSQDDKFKYGLGIKEKIQVKTLNGFVEHNLEIIGSRTNCAILDKIRNNIKMLSTNKKKGEKIGHLKFKSEVNSVPFPTQTWQFKNNKLQLLKLKKSLFKIHGFDQIPKNAELGCGWLVRRPSGYYFNFVCYTPKEEKIPTNKEVGIDMGIRDTITTSDGDKYLIRIPESKKLKKLQMWFSKKKKGSNNRNRILSKIKKEYENLTNKKLDAANKIIHNLKTNYDKIYIQNENLSGWQKGLFGKQVQHSALGTIKSKLKNLQSTQVVDRWAPTTQLCPSCLTKNKLSLNDRMYKCECGYEKDRDIHSAINIRLIGQGFLTYSAMEHSSTVSEEETSTSENSSIFESKSFSVKESVVSN